MYPDWEVLTVHQILSTDQVPKRAAICYLWSFAINEIDNILGFQRPGARAFTCKNDLSAYMHLVGDLVSVVQPGVNNHSLESDAAVDFLEEQCFAGTQVLIERERLAEFAARICPNPLDASSFSVSTLLMTRAMASLLGETLSRELRLFVYNELFNVNVATPSETLIEQLKSELVEKNRLLSQFQKKAAEERTAVHGVQRKRSHEALNHSPKVL